MYGPPGILNFLMWSPSYSPGPGELSLLMILLDNVELYTIVAYLDFYFTIESAFSGL